MNLKLKLLTSDLAAISVHIVMHQNEQKLCKNSFLMTYITCICNLHNKLNINKRASEMPMPHNPGNRIEHHEIYQRVKQCKDQEIFRIDSVSYAKV